MKNLFSTGLKQEDIEKLRAVFSKHKGILEVILYGSRAKGNFKLGSDIDLTIISEKMNLSELLKIEIEIDDLLLPYKIDLSIKSKIENSNLIEHINRVGISFYSSTLKE